MWFSKQVIPIILLHLKSNNSTEKETPFRGLFSVSQKDIYMDTTKLYVTKIKLSIGQEHKVNIPFVSRMLQRFFKALQLQGFQSV